MNSKQGFGPTRPEVTVLVNTDITEAGGPEGWRAALPAALEGVEHWALVVVDETDDDGLDAAVAQLPRSGPVLVVRADVRLGPGSVVALLGALERPGVGIAVPKVVDEAGNLVHTIELGGILGVPTEYEHERPVEGIRSGAALVSRACLDVLCQDGQAILPFVDAALIGTRARDAGLLIWYTPAATVVTTCIAPGGRSAPWICFAANDWWYHNQAHSEFQLMRRVAQHRPVLLVNSIGMRMPLPGRSTRAFRRILLKAGSVLRFVRRPLPDTPNFNVATPFILPFYGSAIVRALNARLVRFQVRLMTRRLGIDVAESVIVVTIPTAWEVVQGLEYRAMLLNRSDLHSAFGETDQTYIRGLERQLLEHCDVALYVSHALMDAEADQTGHRAVFLDHGLDLDRFGGEIGPEPPDLAPIPHPRVGFFGGLDDYLVDFDLLERLATENPDLSVVLIGDATVSMARFDALPNVHWLGFKPAAEIPSYGSGFDVALMPWLRNEWIQNSNPIKLKEYLALGLPIVSMDFPEVRHYADVVSIAGDADAFVRAVREVLQGEEMGSPTTRRARVAGATWDRQANRLLAIGEEVIH